MTLRRFNAHVSQLRRYRSRTETEWRPGDEISSEDDTTSLDEPTDYQQEVIIDPDADNEEEIDSPEDFPVGGKRIVTRTGRVIQMPQRLIDT